MIKFLLFFIGIGLILFCFYLIFSADIENDKKVYTYSKLTRIISIISVTLLIIVYLFILLIIITLFLPGH